MMKSIVLLLAMVACTAAPLQAEVQKSDPAFVPREARYLPQNYLLTVTMERLNKDPFIVSMLMGGRMAELSRIDPIVSIIVTSTLKENDLCLLDYQIGSRVKMGNEQWADEGVKGSVYLSLGKETTIFQEPGRSIKLKFVLPAP